MIKYSKNNLFFNKSLKNKLLKVFLFFLLCLLLIRKSLFFLLLFTFNS